MGICELYKDAKLTVQYNGNIYNDTMKRLYQTFYGKTIQVFYAGTWYNATIIGEASERKMIKINDEMIGSLDLSLKVYRNAVKCIKDLQQSDFIECNTDSIKKIFNNSTGVIKHESIEITDIYSDWLFGVEFEDSDNQYYTLSNGMIVSTK